MFRRPRPDPISPGQESVWEYPRPPRLEQTPRRIRVEFAGVQIADTTRAWRVLETSHPPVYYLPPEDLRMDLLTVAEGGSFCEWKGKAQYYDLHVAERESLRAAWGYPDPTPAFAPIKNHLAFYIDRVGACYIDEERATPQPGSFYGGWITSDVVGPFKGVAGSEGW